MRFSIGAVFIDEVGLVLEKQFLNPWQISRKVPGALAVVEIAPEVLELVRIGDLLYYHK
jgi:hypothetical protein